MGRGETKNTGAIALASVVARVGLQSELLLSRRPHFKGSCRVSGLGFWQG